MKTAIPRRSERKYIDPYIFRGYDGLVHFINVSGLQEKRPPADIKIFETYEGRMVVEDKNGFVVGQFLGKNYKRRK